MLFAIFVTIALPCFSQNSGSNLSNFMATRQSSTSNQADDGRANGGNFPSWVYSNKRGNNHSGDTADANKDAKNGISIVTQQQFNSSKDIIESLMAELACGFNIDFIDNAWYEVGHIPGDVDCNGSSCNHGNDDGRCNCGNASDDDDDTDDTEGDGEGDGEGDADDDDDDDNDDGEADDQKHYGFGIGGSSGSGGSGGSGSGGSGSSGSGSSGYSSGSGGIGSGSSGGGGSGGSGGGGSGGGSGSSGSGGGGSGGGNNRGGNNNNSNRSTFIPLVSPDETESLSGGSGSDRGGNNNNSNRGTFIPLVSPDEMESLSDGVVYNEAGIVPLVVEPGVKYYHHSPPKVRDDFERLLDYIPQHIMWQLGLGEMTFDYYAYEDFIPLVAWWEIAALTKNKVYNEYGVVPLCLEPGHTYYRTPPKRK